METDMDAAKRLIDAVFSDTSADASVTRERLEELIAGVHRREDGSARRVVVRHVIIMSTERREELESCDVCLDVWDATKGHRGDWSEQKTQRGNSIRLRFSNGTALVLDLYHHPEVHAVKCKPDNRDGNLDRPMALPGEAANVILIGVRQRATLP